MPAKRKIKEDPDTVKKVKLTINRTSLTCDQVRWQLEEKPGSWVLFDDETQKILTDSYNNSLEQCEVDDGEFVVIFDKPIRKTVKTSYQKRVRIGIKDSESDDQVYTWSYEDGRGKRHYYSVESVIQLEENRDADALSVLSEGKPCTVNVKEMKHDDKFDMYREVAEAAVAKKSPKASVAPKISGTIKEETTESKEKTVIIKGKAPVDPECKTKLDKASVFYEGDTIWDCMLNQTNLQNNNNKYYLIQLLKDDAINSYSVWMRWGRVGKKGQTALQPCGPDLDDAKKIFCDKFRDKTKNNWAERKAFKKVPGKYDMLEMDYSTSSQSDSVDGPSKAVSEKTDYPDSKLDARLQALIKLICDVKAMEDAVIEMKYDAKKAPLGKLTKQQIMAGYTALKDIELLIKAGDFGFKLTEACNNFYTRIPHDFGMRPPERITSMEILKGKISLLEALGDIEIAVKILQTSDKTVNPVDQHYLSLDCLLEPMKKTDTMYKLIEDYLLWTHGDTHAAYSLALLDVFECSKSSEKSSTVSNKMLLWHGSRLTNWVGILAKGLRIAPPEAPVTGYMFGKGIYFADCSSKSANYCFATKTKNVGMLVLCEVALGSVNELLAADYQADKLPKEKHSVKGCGDMAPDPATFVTLDDGVVVPRGKLKKTGTTNPAGYTLNYNEYIVYKTDQVRMRYLVKVQFNFKY